MSQRFIKIVFIFFHNNPLAFPRFLVNLQSEHIMSEEFSREINKNMGYGCICDIFIRDS